MKNYKLDKTSFSQSFIPYKNLIQIIDNKTINILEKKLKKNKINQTRICLHQSKDFKINVMVILQKKNFTAEIKKHPKKDKCYIHVKGKQIIKIFDDKKKVIQKISLDKKNKVIWLPRNTIHQNISINQTIHIETINGPFIRRKDRVVYD